MIEKLKAEIEQNSGYELQIYNSLLGGYYLAVKYLPKETDIVIKPAKYGWSVIGYICDSEHFNEFCKTSGDIIAVLDRYSRHY